ncbi:MFS general substrate transporter [Pseudovirgaria hyperparasitica]|uniref:MFS general substrate transporter n=1 Tax=Pseudovirgaria hyperparasitica TaxID=470096 RepID=A0A6A6W762_9PEZI|nr:MFS general substrate transporter [Pseudovirgaria hyperparasitica]KAF2757800.1 MFS general substrate transporter [Pseudovirgaria hyperparasitica]
MFLSTWRRARRDASSQTTSQPPFPYRQMSILSLCRLCEPVAFMSVFPYSHSMMQSFGFETEKEIVFYAGMVTSAFAFAEFSTGMYWGQKSDRVGRKPVLLTGMFGTGFSMLAFGFAPNLWFALFARAIGGCLNGNMGVIQTTVAEIVTVESHRPFAYSIIPFIWAIGSVIGAYLGGTLSNPVKAYPELFSAGSFWARSFEKFPYLLPNLVCVLVVFTGLIIGILFLEETHEVKKQQPDLGCQIGRSILRCFPWCAAQTPDAYEAAYDEKGSMTDGNSALLPPRPWLDTYGTNTALADDAGLVIAEKLEEEATSIALRRVFTPQILSIVCATGLLAFHTIAFEQQLPLLMAAPRSTTIPQLPFKFQAGLDMSDKTIGGILSTQGWLQMIAQLGLFPFVNRCLGNLVTFRLVVFAYPILYFLIPYLALLPTSVQVPIMYPVLAWKVVAQSFSYPSAAMMLQKLAPNKNRGSINGVATSSQSICRGFGPLISGAIQSLGTSHGYSGVVWWFCALISLIAALESLFMSGDKEAPVKDVENALLKHPSLLEDVDSDCETTIGDESDSEDEGTLCSSPRPESFDGSFTLNGASDTMALLPKRH